MFDFFGLPRELRDYIYDALESSDMNIDLDEPDSQLTCIAQSLPRSDLLVVNKQFGNEYRQRMAHWTRLVIEDRLLYTGDCTTPTLPKKVLNIPRLHFDLFVTCESEYHVCVDLKHHRARIDHLRAQLRPLRGVTVRLHIEKTPSAISHGLQALALQHGLVSTVNGLKSLDISCVDFRGAVDSWDYRQSSQPLMKWRVSRGLQMCEVR